MSDCEIKPKSVFIYLNGVKEVLPTSTKVNKLVPYRSPSQSVEVSERGVEGGGLKVEVCAY